MRRLARSGGLHDTLQPAAERRPVGPAHLEVARLPAGVGEDLLAVQVEVVLRLRRHEARKFLLQQRPAVEAQQAGGGQIGLVDDALGVEGQVADRREVVEPGEAVARVFQFQLDAAQFLVLDFQFRLMHLQLVDQLPHIPDGHWGSRLR